MFDHALINRTTDGKGIDLGALAEVLFFYSKVRVMLDRGALISLVQQVPQDVLLKLFDLDIIQFSYIREYFAVMRAGVPIAYNFGAMRLNSRDDGKQKIRNFEDDVEDALTRTLGASKDTARLTKDLLKRIDRFRYRGVPEKEKAILESAHGDMADVQFVQNAAIETLKRVAPRAVQPGLFFKVFRTDKEDYWVDTNMPTDVVAVDGILANILSARAETFLSAYYMADAISSPSNAAIMQIKHFEFLRRRNINSADIDLFHEIIVPDVPTIREAISTGEKSFSEYLDFLKTATRFKRFLADASPDVGLVQSYNKEVVQKSWVEKLPGKTTRFIAAQGASLLGSLAGGPLGGLAVSGTNTFFVDRLVKGWRPNRFIDGPYKKFVAS